MKMGRIIELNNNNNLAKLDGFRRIAEEDAQADLDRKNWENKISKWWNMFIFLFTISWAIISVVLILAYVLKGVTIPVVEFISVLTTPFIPFAVNRFVIFLSIFKKSAPR
jgi:hypothetical protein